MKNFRQPGHTCTLIAPYPVLSGGGFLVGSLFAVANCDAAIGAEVEGDLDGVFVLPKTAGAGTDATPGTKVYWDNAGKLATKTAAGNTLIGATIVAATTVETSYVVRLNGVAV